jgi:hypothetical protein
MNNLNNLNNTDTNCVSKIHEQTNTRIYNRNIPSQMLQPYIDVRPVMTKYSYMPIVDPRKQINVKMEQMPTYNSHNIFNPGNTTSPWSGFASGVNTESELRNQIFALQKCEQSVYVPGSNSDLYNYSFKPNNSQSQTHSLLFQKDSFCDFNPNPDDKLVGTGLFYNSTRSQIKEIGDK